MANRPSDPRPAGQQGPSSDGEPLPQLIEVKKYPNRRLYDSTRSQHLTHEELYDLVVAGRTVRVTESKTGADITNLVLMQALIERNPEKFGAFPPELVHLLIRASDSMLRGFATNWFAQVMNTMSGMGATKPGGAGAAAWPMPPVFPWNLMQPPHQQQAAARPAAPEPASAPTAQAPDAMADLQRRMDALMAEVAALKRGQGR